MANKRIDGNPSLPPGQRQAFRPEDELSIPQKLFVYEMIKEINNGCAIKDQAGAAIRAGYSPRTAAEQASRLMNNPKIKAAIDAEMKKIEKRALISVEKVIANVIEIGERCMQHEPVLDKHGNPTGEYRFDSQGALRAQELLGKHLEVWTDKIKQSGEVKLEVVVNEVVADKIDKGRND